MEKMFDPVESTPDAPGDAATSSPIEPSPAVQRFETCRWRQAQEDTIPAHCTHRDVVTIAGTQGFSADAWCADCSFYKVKRTPRKRPAPQSNDPYYY